MVESRCVCIPFLVFYLLFQRFSDLNLQVMGTKNHKQLFSLRTCLKNWLPLMQWIKELLTNTKQLLTNTLNISDIDLCNEN